MAVFTVSSQDLEDHMCSEGTFLLLLVHTIQQVKRERVL